MWSPANHQNEKPEPVKDVGYVPTVQLSDTASIRPVANLTSAAQMVRRKQAGTVASNSAVQNTVSNSNSYTDNMAMPVVKSDSRPSEETISRTVDYGAASNDASPTLAAQAAQADTIEPAVWYFGGVDRKNILPIDASHGRGKRTQGLEALMYSHIPKLSIEVEASAGKFEKTVEALFNPNQISINKSSRWRTSAQGETDTGKSHFPYGEPATMTLDLFFDTYEEGTDVREHTRELFYLTTIQEHGDLHRPPLCKIQWGAFNISDEYQCAWVLQSLNQRFTLFLADGMPVRATLSCTFRQWRSDELETKLLDRRSVDVSRRRVVSSRDTLSSIAAEVYEDPLLWRPIAEANNIHQPRKLVTGQVLTIPALRSRKYPVGK